MQRTAAAQGVIRREAERAALRAFLAARDGPAALVIEGEAGIGKTTLFEEALREAGAGGCRILRCRPAPTETRLAFTGLADLLAGRMLDDALPTLPAPQRHALEVALLREEATGAAPDVRAIASGLLGVLRHVSAQSPVVIAIDDVQWLDSPTRTVLEFAARRGFFAGQVVLLLARRSSGDEELPLGLSGALPENIIVRMTLAPMDPAALHELLATRQALTLSLPALRQLHERSGGNPFYALALGRRATPSGLDAEQPLPLPSVVDERLAELPEPVLDLLQRVALLYDRQVGAVARVAAPGALDAAVEAGVLELSGDRVAFTHPLLAAAVESMTGPERRATLHGELAGVEATGEARALHLALATWVPDATVAGELDSAARRAARQGAEETAARLAEHAARLTPRTADSLAAQRTVAAAEHYAAAGDPRRAHELLSELIDRLEPGPARAEALSLQCWLHTSVVDFAASVRVGEQAIAEAGGDARLIAVTRQRLGTAERIRGRLDASEAHGVAAVEGAQRVGDEGLEALALASLGLTRFVRGAGVGPELRRAAELERRLPEFLGQQAPSFRLGLALLVTDQFDEARAVFTDLGEQALAAGHEDARAMVLSYLADLERRSGHWERAQALTVEARDLGLQAGTEQEQNAGAANAALLAAMLGHVDEARAMARRGLAVADDMGDRIHAIAHRGALGLLELSLDAPAAAVEWLAPATDELLEQGVVELGLHPEIVHNEIEGLVAVGDQGRATRLTTHLETVARRTDRPWAHAIAARSRALVLAAEGDLGRARECALRAVTEHENAGQPLELARSLTVSGALERRAKQRRSSRVALERAIAVLDALPAPLWAARARAELGRLGQRLGPSELTVTEARIAALAAEGRSNPEIAAAAFVSRKTVEANLSRIYKKLGVRSRVELSGKLDR